jgi:hypothetical protein
MPARLSDLVTSRDGTLSLTKTAACTAHFMVAAAFFKYQLLPGTEFSAEIWGLYIGVAILHAAYDKTTAQVQAVRELHIQAEVDKVHAVAPTIQPEQPR